MTEYKKHPWPTNGATRKQLDKVADKLHARLDRQRRTADKYYEQTRLIIEFLEKGPHSSAWQLFLQTKEESD